MNSHQTNNDFSLRRGRYIIIGTAGHVDHGKTALIKALTGTDTDRLAEEKKRGITIELGFASLLTPDGRRIGIIDVPGHERFVGNMLAGAGSIGIAMLIVAADEGFMPQTREHLDILRLLNVPRGVVVLTKMDAVDPDWAELVKLDIAEQVEGTFLEDAPIMPVSAHTGQGVDELKELLYNMVADVGGRVDPAPTTAFRLPIDRVFTMDGFGTVVTGTVTQGQLAVGDEVTVFPQLLPARVRNIQVHGESAEVAHSGQRAAVNLGGVKYTEIERGSTIATPDSMELSHLLDVAVTILPNCTREIKHNSRLHLHHGSGSVLCRVMLMESDKLTAGQSGYAQLLLSSPLGVKMGDRTVLRFFSPMETVGGAVILDPHPPRHKRKDADIPKVFAIKEQGSVQDKLSLIIAEQSENLPKISRIRRVFFDNCAGVAEAEQRLIDRGEIHLHQSGVCVYRDYISAISARCVAELTAFHSANPLAAGMRAIELRERVLPGTEGAIADWILSAVAEDGQVKLSAGIASLASFAVKFSPAQQKLVDGLTKLYHDTAYASPSFDEAMTQLGADKKAFVQAMEMLVSDGTLVRLTDQVYLHGEHYSSAWEVFVKLAEERGEVVLGDFRDALSTSRKYAVALLEYFDLRKLTRKVGDGRVVSG